MVKIKEIELNREIDDILYVFKVNDCFVVSFERGGYPVGISIKDDKTTVEDRCLEDVMPLLTNKEYTEIKEHILNENLWIGYKYDQDANNGFGGEMEYYIDTNLNIIEQDGSYIGVLFSYDKNKDLYVEE